MEKSVIGKWERVASSFSGGCYKKVQLSAVELIFY
jgi:hypothetical protein